MMKSLIDWWRDLDKGFTALALAVFVLGSIAIGSVLAWLMPKETPAGSVHSISRYVGGYSIFVDPETGCEYLSYNSTTPRLGRDGRQICLDSNVQSSQSHPR